MQKRLLSLLCAAFLLLPLLAAAPIHAAKAKGAHPTLFAHLDGQTPGLRGQLLGAFHTPQ